MTPYERNTPHSPEAERTVIASCMLSRESLEAASLILKPDDFYDGSNGIIFEALRNMLNSNRPIDLITVSEELKAKGVFDRLGGQPFLSEITEGIITMANISYYAEIVREHAVRRKLIDAGSKIIDLAYQNTPPSEIIEEAEKLILEASQNKDSSDFKHISDVIGLTFNSIRDRYEESDASIAGYSSSFADLDNYTGGFQPGSLNIIAARPSMGKTAFALNIAQYGGGSDNRPVLIFSLEMPAEQLAKRMLAAESRIDLSKLSHGTMSANEFKYLQEVCKTVAERNIYINDDSDLTIMDFRTRCRRFKTKHDNLALVVVDYLQLMSSGERRPEGRQQEVAEISRMLKASARELNCPVIALSQLSRAAEQRTEKKPQLSDLRDSGAIEQDADIVMLMFREDYYSENENNDLQDSKADIRIAKNRNGSTGTIHLVFKREITRFFNFGEE